MKMVLGTALLVGVMAILVGCSGEKKASEACRAAKKGDRVTSCYELAKGSWYAKERADQSSLAEGRRATWETELDMAITEECKEPMPPQCTRICRMILSDPEFKNRASHSACESVVH